MKAIPLPKSQAFDARVGVRNVVGDGKQGFNWDEMKRRGRVLDRLDDLIEADGELLLLEDADYEVLCGVLKSYPSFGTAEKVVRDVIEGILSAQEPAPRKDAESGKAA